MLDRPNLNPTKAEQLKSLMDELQRKAAGKDVMSAKTVRAYLATMRSVLHRDDGNLPG